MTQSSELKSILRLLTMFWMVLKWAIILACAVAVFLYFNRQIEQTDHMSDILETGTADPVVRH